jgi:glutaredoxin 3
VVIPSPTELRRLVLYKDDYCGFCRRVYRAVERLGLDLEMADTRTDPEAKKLHLERTGRRTVPCLYIDDIPLFESADIIEWLEGYVESGPSIDG